MILNDCAFSRHENACNTRPVKPCVFNDEQRVNNPVFD